MINDSEFSVEALPDLRSAPEQWLEVVPQIQGESLTSQLGRQARLWGVPVQSLLRELLTADHASLPDLDVAPPQALVDRIAARLGELPSDLDRGTFRNILPHLIPPDVLAKVQHQRWKLSHLPWILPSGWQGHPSSAMRRGGGIPYCPICVGEGGTSHSPLTHRLAFNVACTQHKIWLLDRCPTCEVRSSPAVVELHPHSAGGGTGIRCDSCPPMLPTRESPIEKADALVIELQHTLLEGLDSGKVSVPQLGHFPTVQYLGGLRFAFLATVWLREQGVSLPPARFGKTSQFVVRSRGVRGGPFETQSLSERIFRMKGAAWILAAPLDRWGLLHQLCAWPNHLSKSWRHPWEGLTETGAEIRNDRWGVKTSRQPEARDVQMVCAFFDLVENLGIHPVRVQGLLGNISSSRYQRWRNLPTTRFPLDCYRRMEAFMRLWDLLLAFFNSRSVAYKWLMQPNKHSLFGGNAPIDSFAEEGCLHRFHATIALFG